MLIPVEHGSPDVGVHTAESKVEEFVVVEDPGPSFVGAGRAIQVIYEIVNL